MAMQNVTAALSNQTLIELFQNCSYKAFLDQGGARRTEPCCYPGFSAKDLKHCLPEMSERVSWMWNKNVVRFDALISKENVLYKNYSTNFHEKAKEQKRLSFEEEVVPNFGTKRKNRATFCVE